jgi:hypothetical protein
MEAYQPLKKSWLVANYFGDEDGGFFFDSLNNRVISVWLISYLTKIHTSNL